MKNKKLRKEYYQKNKERINICSRKYYQENKEQARLSNRKYYLKNKKKILAAQRIYEKEHRKETNLRNRIIRRKLKKEIFNLLGNKCIKCNFSDGRALQIDHIKGGGGKDFALFNGNRITYSKNVIKSIKRSTDILLDNI